MGAGIRRIAVAGLIALSAPVWAASPQELADTLKLDTVTGIMRDEGLAYAEDIAEDMLAGGGGALWETQVARIYAPGTMRAALTEALDSKMTAEQRDVAVEFFDSDMGQAILDYENAARAAMADPDVEEIARATYQDMRAGESARLDLLKRFVALNDLVERNVAGALSSNYQFFRGLSDGGAYEMTEDQILSDVWAQEQEIRDDTSEWLFGFLNMAYRPLDDAELRAYADFSETDAGRALNAALFEGFDTLYRDISYALGLAVAQSMRGSDL